MLACLPAGPALTLASCRDRCPCVCKARAQTETTPFNNIFSCTSTAMYVDLVLQVLLQLQPQHHADCHTLSVCAQSAPVCVALRNSHACPPACLQVLDQPQHPETSSAPAACAQAALLCVQAAPPYGRSAAMRAHLGACRSCLTSSMCAASFSTSARRCLATRFRCCRAVLASPTSTFLQNGPWHSSLTRNAALSG